MPLFIISGYFFNNKICLKNFLSKMVKSLLLLYLICIVIVNLIILINTDLSFITAYVIH